MGNIRLWSNTAWVFISFQLKAWQRLYSLLMRMSGRKKGILRIKLYIIYGRLFTNDDTPKISWKKRNPSHAIHLLYHFTSRPHTLFVVHDENYSYQFELHDKNRKLCLRLLPFINGRVKGDWDGATRSVDKSERKGLKPRVMFVMPWMFYLWVSSTHLAS